MKKLFTLIFCLTSLMAAAQKIIVDTMLQKKYNDAYVLAYKNLSEHDQQYMDGENKNRPWLSFLIATTYRLDTLNQKDLSVKGRSSGMRTPFLRMFESVIIGDTLSISDLFGGVFFIVTKRSSAKYQIGKVLEEFAHLPHVIASQAKAVNIIVKPRFLKLSSLNLKPGHVIYGETEYVSKPFLIGNNNSVSGHIKEQLHIKYIFKITTQTFRRIRKDPKS